MLSPCVCFHQVDGSEGLLVADEKDIKRLDGNGAVVQRYDVKGRNGWFSLNLDPNGTSFWAADSEADELVRFDIVTGKVESRFQAGPGNTIFGVCLKGELTAGVGSVLSVLPTEYSLSQNAPNPFNPSTLISFSLPDYGAVKLVVYNALGQHVRTLIDGEVGTGQHQITWNGMDDSGRAVSTGVFIYRLTTDEFVKTRRMVLLK